MKVYYEETRDIGRGGRKYLDLYVETRKGRYYFYRIQIPTNKKYKPRRTYLKAAKSRNPLLKVGISKDFSEYEYFEI